MPHRVTNETNELRSLRAQGIIDLHALGWRVTPSGVVVRPDGEGQTTHLNTSGYPVWSSRVGARRQDTRVHQLQAYQLYGRAALAHKTHTRHLDGNRTNNRADNIAIGTSSENQLDLPAAVRRARGLLMAAKRRKLTPDQVRAVRLRLAAGETQTALAREFGFVSRTVHRIARGLTYAEVPE